MNRKERKAQGIKGKKGDQAVIFQALSLARELKKKKKSAEAIKLYKQILEFDPDNLIALVDVGINTYAEKQIEQAEVLFEKVLRLDHKNLGAIVMLAAIRMDQNRIDEALDLVYKAERLGIPPGFQSRMGILYRDTGKIEKANYYIEGALKADPEDISALFTVQSLRKFTSEELERLEKMSQKSDIDLENKIRIGFSLGKACIDHEQTSKGFWHFAEANLLKRASFKFAIEWVEEYFADIAKLFDKDFRDKYRGKIQNKGGNQIFIIGMPRSGSTLVDQIISSHPDVTSVGEASFYNRSVPLYVNEKMKRFSKNPGPMFSQEFIDHLSTEMLEKIGDRYLSLVNPFTKEQKVVVDKMLFSFVWLGLIRLTLPDAKIIHCVRDPIDIGLSIWQLLFTDDMPWAYDQNDIGRYFLAYSKLMDHWREIFPGEFFDNHYEDMVADQEGQSRKVIEFCGLEWHDDCLRFYENKRRVKTASVTQVRKPMYKDSVKKWKKYEQYLTRLVDTVEGRQPPPDTSAPEKDTAQTEVST